MLFNSFSYIFLFLPISLILYFLACRFDERVAKSVLFCLCIFFYVQWKLVDLPVLIFSIVFNFSIVFLMEKYATARKRLLWAGLAVNLALLFSYKYINFFSENVSLVGLDMPKFDVTIPLGISFFTFQQIAYLVDSYRGLVAQREKFSNFAVFVSFFPQLVAGPIVHHREMMPQFKDKKNLRVNYSNIYYGLVLFSLGLFKKICIADVFSNWANNGYDHVEQITAAAAWVATLSYTFQIYFDFSAYSDMALGAALMFNIRLPINFSSPYKAASIQDFWRRWHITLSRFLRDYLYVTLGGNRHAKPRTMINILVVFLLGGLWHGAAWTFVAWGAIHGVAMTVHRLWAGVNFTLPTWIAIGLTFFVVHVSWVFFRAPSFESAFSMLENMLGQREVVEAAWTPPMQSYVYIAAAAMIVWMLPNSNQLVGREPYREALISQRIRPAVYATMAGVAVTAMLFQQSKIFLYFNF